MTNVLLSILHSPAAQLLLWVPIALTLLDVLTGVVVAVRAGSFRMKMLSDFASHNLTAYVAILLTTAVAIASGVSADVAANGASLAILAYCAAQLGSIGEHIADLTGLPYVGVLDAIQAIAHRITPGASINAPTQPPSGNDPFVPATPPATPTPAPAATDTKSAA